LPTALKHHREAKGFSMRRLGTSLNVSHSTIADWEHARSYPSSFEVQRLADALGVSICELYGVEEGHASPSDADLTQAEQDALDAIARELVKLRGATGYIPSRADQDTRDMLRIWDGMKPDQRRDWLTFAQRLTNEEEMGNQGS